MLQSIFAHYEENNMFTYNYILPRTEGMKGLTLVAFISLSHPVIKDKKELFSLFEASITEWVKATDSGAIAWEESCEDFNIGDFAQNDNNSELAEILKDNKITINHFFIDGPEDDLCYDRILVNSSELDN